MDGWIQRYCSGSCLDTQTALGISSRHKYSKIQINATLLACLCIQFTTSSYSQSVVINKNTGNTDTDGVRCFITRTVNSNKFSKTAAHSYRQCFSNCSPQRSQTVLGERALRKLYQTLKEWKIHPYLSVLKLPLSVYLNKKVHELVISIIYWPSIIIVENALN
jgi:hypothetical protein